MYSGELLPLLPLRSQKLTQWSLSWVPVWQRFPFHTYAGSGCDQQERPKSGSSVPRCRLFGNKLHEHRAPSCRGKPKGDPSSTITLIHPVRLCCTFRCGALLASSISCVCGCLCVTCVGAHYTTGSFSVLGNQFFMPPFFIHTHTHK